jgi:hypothetical protein
MDQPKASLVPGMAQMTMRVRSLCDTVLCAVLEKKKIKKTPPQLTLIVPEQILSRRSHDSASIPS